MYTENLIVQLETKPISEDDMLTISEIMWLDQYNWFLYSVPCSGVNEDEWHDETINEFINYLCSFAPYVEVSNTESEKWVIFKEGFAQVFFESIYPDFKNTLQELADNTSLDALIGKKYEMSTPFFRLRNIFSGTYGMYVKGKIAILKHL